MKMLSYVASASIILLTAPAIAQTPPPPPPPGQENVGRGLIAVFARKDMNAYGSLLADDVQVYEEGHLVARNKAEWLRRFGPELEAKGVIFKLSPGYSSAGRLLFIEYFNSLASWGSTPPPDCCWGYAAVAYDISEGRIVKIQRLNGGARRLGDNGADASN